jgi:hypothetical protein
VGAASFPREPPPYARRLSTLPPTASALSSGGSGGGARVGGIALPGLSSTATPSGRGAAGAPPNQPSSSTTPLTLATRPVILVPPPQLQQRVAPAHAAATLMHAPPPPIAALPFVLFEDDTQSLPPPPVSLLSQTVPPQQHQQRMPLATSAAAAFTTARSSTASASAGDYGEESSPDENVDPAPTISPALAAQRTRQAAGLREALSRADAADARRVAAGNEQGSPAAAADFPPVHARVLRPLDAELVTALLPGEPSFIYVDGGRREEEVSDSVDGEGGGGHGDGAAVDAAPSSLLPVNTRQLPLAPQPISGRAAPLQQHPRRQQRDSLDSVLYGSSNADDEP